MNNYKNENLDELFNTVSGDDAEEMAKNLKSVENIISRYEIPLPDSRLLSNIKNEISRKLSISKRRVFARRFSYGSLVSAAAVFLIVMSIMKFGNNATVPQKPAAAATENIAWDSEVTYDQEGTSQLAVFKNELTSLENEIFALESDEYSIISEDSLDQMEIEFLETDYDFGKGWTNES